MKKLKLFILSLIAFTTISLTETKAQHIYGITDGQLIDEMYAYSTGCDTIVLSIPYATGYYYPGMTVKAKIRRYNTGNIVYLKVNNLERTQVWWARPSGNTTTNFSCIADTLGTAQTGNRIYVDSVLVTGQIATFVLDTVGTPDKWWFQNQK